MEDKEVSLYLMFVTSALIMYLGNHDKAWARVIANFVLMGAWSYAFIHFLSW